MNNTNNTLVVQSFRNQPVQQTAVSAKTIDLNNYVIATHDGNRTPAGKIVSTGLYTIPVHVGSKFKQITIPMSDKETGVMMYALGLHPSMGWVKDDKLVLHYGNMPFDAFCAKYGIVLGGGIGQMSKRISRWLRPQALWGYFDAKMINIKYRTVGLVRSVSMDGIAYWINRKMLIRVAEERIATTPNMSAKDKKALRRMARHALRVEGTFINAEGQYKGDGLVVDTKEYDLMLIAGTAKTQLKMVNGKVFISAQVRHTSQLRLDVQTIMNLNVNGLLSKEQLASWMTEYAQHRLDQFDSGKSVEIIDSLFSKQQWQSDAEAILKYPLYDYVLSGGQPSWFRYTTEAILKSGLTGLLTKGLTELSFLVPGRNYYIIPASAFQMAGLNVHVKRGEIRLMDDYASIVVNDVDAVTSDERFATVDELEKFCNGDEDVLKAIRKDKPGIFQTLSGADNDDGIKCLPVRHDDTNKVIMMRSPNEIGQWEVGHMAADSDMPEWCDKPVVPVELDLTLLPEQVAQGERPTLGLIGDPIKIEGWSEQKLFDTAQLMIRSAGAVGIQALRAWFEVQMHGDLPDGTNGRRAMPDEISNLVDAAVKDFADCSAVNTENKDGFVALAEASCQPGGPKVALCRADKFQVALPPNVVFESAMTWIDEMYLATDAVIDWYALEIHKRGQMAMPPMELFKKGLKFAHAGRGFKSTWGSFWFNYFDGQEPEEKLEGEKYAVALFAPRDEVGETIKKENSEMVYADVRNACIDYMTKFPRNIWGMAMVGGLAHTYAEASSHKGEIKDGFEIKDAAFWQQGEKVEDGGRGTGFGDITVEGLRQAGIIGEVKWDADDNEIVVVDATHPVATEITTLKLRHVWFNLLVAQGKTTATSPFQIKDKQIIAAAKAAADAMVMDNLVITVGYKEVARKNKTDMYNVAFGPRGNVIGTLPEDTYMDYITDGHLQVIGASTDGDYTYVVCEEVQFVD